MLQVLGKKVETSLSLCDLKALCCTKANIQKILKYLRSSQSHCAKVQKYEQGKIGLQFFDMWYQYCSKTNQNPAQVYF